MVRCIDVRAGKVWFAPWRNPTSAIWKRRFSTNGASRVAEAQSIERFRDHRSLTGEYLWSYPCLLKARENPAVLPTQSWLVIVLIIAVLVGLVVLFVFFSFVRLWIQSFLTGAASASWT